MDSLPKKIKSLRRRPMDSGSSTSVAGDHSPDSYSTDLSPREILAGLPPQLVIDLARLAGVSLTDLGNTLQIAPYGDRAVMAAYGLIELLPATDPSLGRRVRALPQGQLVARAAAELVLEAADPTLVAEHLRDYGDASMAAQQYVPVKAPADQEMTEDQTCVGVIRSAEEVSADRLALKVTLARTGRMNELAQATLDFLTQADPAFRRGAAVRMRIFRDEEERIQPVAICGLEAFQ